MFSIYSSLYNINNLWIDWQESINRFCSFADEVVISTSNNPDDYKPLEAYISNYPSKLKIIRTDISFDDPLFDGKFKNAALKACTKPFCILLDGDESIPLSTKKRWINYANLIKDNSSVDGLLIPSINLCKDEYHYKDINFKFYLHKNNIGIERGVVNYAKLDDGKINIKLSDTTEPCIKGNLANFVKLSNNIYDIKNQGLPYVFHYWAVDFNKRIKANKFWSPVWDNRAGHEIKDIILNREDLEKIEVFEHNLL